jgi:predicted RNA-binding protein YlqC (UPF0109 family)
MREGRSGGGDGGERRGDGGERRGDGRGRRRPPGDRGGDRGGERLTAAELAQLSRLVGVIARALVDQPDKVVVRETNEHFPRIELQVAPDDIGKVIGKDGRTAQSIRTLIAAASTRGGRRPLLDIVD